MMSRIFHSISIGQICRQIGFIGRIDYSTNESSSIEFNYGSVDLLSHFTKVKCDFFT